eukprot:ctg_148.g116
MSVGAAGVLRISLRSGDGAPCGRRSASVALGVVKMAAGKIAATDHSAVVSMTTRCPSAGRRPRLSVGTRPRLRQRGSRTRAAGGSAVADSSLLERNAETATASRRIRAPDKAVHKRVENARICRDISCRCAAETQYVDGGRRCVCAQRALVQCPLCRNVTLHLRCPMPNGFRQPPMRSDRARPSGRSATTCSAREPGTAPAEIRTGEGNRRGVLGIDTSIRAPVSPIGLSCGFVAARLVVVF